MGGLDRMIQAHGEQGLATGEPDADRLLRNDGNAVVIGVLLDQQVRAEAAFQGPWKLYLRLGHLDMGRIANMDDEAFAAVFAEKPAVHRFSNMMAARVQALARHLAENFGGEAARLWNDDADLATVRRRASLLPGFGPAKIETLPFALRLFGHRSFTPEP